MNHSLTDPAGHGPQERGGRRATVTQLHPHPAQAEVRIAGVVVIDLTRHVEHGTLMSFQPTVFTPASGYAPGTNIEVQIGRAVRVHPSDANLRAIVAAAHAGTTIVVKGFEADGVTEAQRVLSRLIGLTPRPERLGCERDACELLYGPSKCEGPRR